MMHALFALLATLQTTPAPIALSDGLMIGGVVRGGRFPVIADSVQAQIVAGSWKFPTVGDVLNDPDGKEHKWEAAPKPNKEGWIEADALESGYYAIKYHSETRKVMLLDPQGASMVYVNGVPVVGDPYGFGYVKVPVLIKSGDNEFLFSSGRGHVKPSLTTPTSDVLVGDDLTLPDFVEKRVMPATSLVGVQIINASERPIYLNQLLAGDKVVPENIHIEPLGARKVRLYIPLPATPGEAASFAYTLKSDDGRKVSFKLPFRLRKVGDTYKVTYLSSLDWSTQYYAIRPSREPDKNNALVLSLHGASVEATNQADAYGPRHWATVICATNRRPFGFDWEDWGRQDALDVLAHARKRIPHDDSRVFLTGHSMGGHGTWHIGTTYPDLFAAIGPSAGWISFSTYAGGLKIDAPTDAEKALLTATSPSDTLSRVKNLKPLGVYILHGDKDDNVPVTEARKMRDTLAAFHTGVTYFEKPGAGHWWNDQDEPGASCVDWAPMFDMFSRRRKPDPREIRDLEFYTSAPNISSHDYWASIDQQTVPFQVSSVNLHLDPNLRRISGTTDNVAALTLDTKSIFEDDNSVTLKLDGVELKDLKPQNGKITLRHAKSWIASASVPDAEKNPTRGGGFKMALRRHIAIVYGTHGTPTENAWMLSKALYDAGSFWYRGNGDAEAIPDTRFNPQDVDSRDVLLIGNRENNVVWPALLGDSPVDVHKGEVRVGAKTYHGDDKVVLFCRPSGAGMVACVGITGLPGAHLAERLPYFVSGVAYPDYTVIGPDVLKTGTKGVLDAGWFDNQWKLPQ